LSPIFYINTYLDTGNLRDTLVREVIIVRLYWGVAAPPRPIPPSQELRGVSLPIHILGEPTEKINFFVDATLERKRSLLPNYFALFFILYFYTEPTQTLMAYRDIFYKPL